MSYYHRGQRAGTFAQAATLQMNKWWASRLPLMKYLHAGEAHDLIQRLLTSEAGAKHEQCHQQAREE